MGTTETSMAAYEAIKPSANDIRHAVRVFMKSVGDLGATDDEMQIDLELSGSTQRPRRWELQYLGEVKDSGMVRPTRAKRKAVVWVYVTDSKERKRLHEEQKRMEQKRLLLSKIDEILQTLELEELEEVLDYTRMWR